MDSEIAHGSGRSADVQRVAGRNQNHAELGEAARAEFVGGRQGAYFTALGNQENVESGKKALRASAFSYAEAIPFIILKMFCPERRNTCGF
jgi:hypothetical protein